MQFVLFFILHFYFAFYSMLDIRIITLPLSYINNKYVKVDKILKMQTQFETYNENIYIYV